VSRWRVDPDGFDLAKVDPGSTAKAPGDKAETKAATDALRERLVDLQERLWAEAQRGLLIVLQAMDGGGKDGTIRSVFGGVNPQGCVVTGFKVPSAEELAHDFLWRIHESTPAKGMIGIFNRSHYEDVLVVKVHGHIDERECRDRFERINAFERHLVSSGTTVLKLMLHISKDEQAERFRKRLDDPAKRWKFRAADLDERALWDEYQAAYEAALSATSTDGAPWHCIPADHKWYRDWAVMTVVVDTLEAMDPRFPEPDPALDGIEIT
jgi:PPK2 family polyphosphate:nucleotide phosphotransferase